MTLIEKARKEAKKNGKRVSSNVAKGLEAVQAMHEMCRRKKGSPYRMFVSQCGK